MASIREHAKKDGTKSWYVLWRDPDTGKQTSLPFTDQPRAELVQKLLNANGQRLSVVEKALTEAKQAEKTITLNEVFEKHLEAATRPNERTIADYKRIWRDHGIETGMGTRPAALIDDQEVGAWLKANLKTRAHKTMANTIGLLSSVFKTAVRRGWAPANPCDLVRMPAANATTRKATFLTVKEFWRLHDEVTPRHQLMVRTFAASGLRYSELTALEVGITREALDRKVPAIPVVRAWVESERRGTFDLGEPKAGSVRDVSIQSDLAEDILTRIENWAPDALVFPNRNGTQLRNTTFHQAGWQDAITAARAKGLRKTPRIHDLRHTHASWMLSEGMTVYDLSKRLGHKSTAITEGVYGHLMQKAMTEGATMIGSVMKR